MNIAHLLLKCLAPMARRFELRTKDPIRAQKKILFKYLSRNKNTEFGKRHKFSSIRSIEDFQARLPISSYENLRVFTERMAAGEKNVLTADRPVFFGRTKRGCVIPYEIFEIQSYNARYYTILRIAIEHDITTLATLNPSAIIILCQKINAKSEFRKML